MTRTELAGLPCSHMDQAPTILVTEPISEEALRWLDARARVMQVGCGDAGFERALLEAEALIVRTYTTVDASLLEMAPKLTVVGRAGTGLDNIDLQACEQRGIEIVNTPAANRQAVVEYVTTLLTNALRPIPEEAPGGLSPSAWATARSQAMAPRQMSECMLGIVGLGQIGRRVAQVASAIGFQVQFYDLEAIEEAARHGAKPVDLKVLLQSSDVVSFHVDGQPENRLFMSPELLSLLKDDVLLINTSRGFIMASECLAGALRSRPKARAILDVHEREPIPSDDPLLGLPGVTLLPHAASRTESAQRAMSWVVRDVWLKLSTEAT